LLRLYDRADAWGGDLGAQKSLELFKIISNLDRAIQQRVLTAGQGYQCMGRWDPLIIWKGPGTRCHINALLNLL